MRSKAIMREPLFLSMNIQEKGVATANSQGDYRSFVTCLDLVGVRWELRGYGGSAVEAAADGWERFKNIDEWYMYGYTIEGEQHEDS